MSKSVVLDNRSVFKATLCQNPDMWGEISPLSTKALAVLFGNDNFFELLDKGVTDYNLLLKESGLETSEVLALAVNIQLDFKVVCSDLFQEGKAMWEKDIARQIISMPVEDVDTFREATDALRDVMWTVDKKRSATELAIEKLARLQEGKSSVITTGNNVVDELMYTGEGEIITIGAESGIGKTTFLLELLYLYITLEHKVLFNSMEIAVDDVLIKMGCQVLGYSYKKAMKAKLKPSDYTILTEFVHKITKGGNFVLASETSLSGLTREIKSSGARIVANDFVNMMEGCSTVEGMEQTQYRMKKIAKSFGITMINLVQLNKSTGMNAGKMPDIHNLKGSGAIREVSTEVLLLYREGFYYFDESGKPISDKFTIKMAKSRYGEMYIYNLRWLEGGRPDVYNGWYNEYHYFQQDTDNIIELVPSLHKNTRNAISDDDIGDMPF